MQTIKEEQISINAANEMLQVELEPALWEFIVRMINYPELRFDKKTQHIHINGYVPFKELAKEWITGIKRGTFDVRPCESCAAFFDINQAQGIYGKPEDIEAFICLPCSEQMSARDYYERYISAV